MKILAVLSALATVAIAAPALEEHIDSRSLTSNDFTIKQHREKKSTLLETAKQHTDHSEDLTSAIASGKSGPSSLVERTFSGFKKPIIVKKKIGYHVYRDSDEELAQADSRENCKKQIKVKLCDDNNSVDKMKSASIDHTQDEMTESEMKHTINMAKEAVEIFQRDLEKMEHNSVENTGQRHNTLVHDKELQKDIEKARQALEDIKEKFNTLDSSPTMNDKKKSDEQRMAQWKENINNHKSVEIARNMEDNFKPSTFNTFKDSGLNDSDKEINSFATIEDANMPTSLNTRKAEDGIISVIEDKETRMGIQSDSLKKNHEHEIMEKNEHDNISEQDTKSIQLERNNMDTKDKHTWNDLESKDLLKSTDDRFAHDVGDHTPLKSENLMKNEHSSSIDETEQVPQESKHVDTVLTTNINKSLRSDSETDMTESNQNKAKENHNVNNFELGSTLSQKSFTDSVSRLVNNNKNNMHHETNVKEAPLKMDLHRSTEKESPSTNSEQILNHQADSHKTLESNMDSIRSSASVATLKSDNENVHETLDKDKDNEMHNLRATSDFHKKLINNMEFAEDSHKTHFNKPFLTENDHMKKNGKPQVLERHVPQVEPNSEHLQAMMHFSDSSHQNTNQKAQLKMAPVFNNDQPNFNVQFNTPETFVEQKNDQVFVPFKAASDFQDRHVHDKIENLSDPLKIRWAHENNLNLEKLKAAHFQEEHMNMDGSSQHFNVDKSMPFRNRAMDNQHLDINEQFNVQQRWAQTKGLNTHNRMMHEKSNIDSAMQPNSYMHMRGAPKMGLDFTSPNQFNQNHGAFRASYGPGMSASYGTGGGSPSYGSSSGSGGSAVGLFPNANVGNCAVPILLSCSPSVVSGSLAKTNTYSAPSYRSEDMNFIKKRNTDTGDDNPGLKLQRHTSLSHNYNQPRNIILENNL